VRKLSLSLTFWLAGVLLSTNSLALGLGEIEVNSFLNQPLDAKIEVISARSGEIDNLLVTLASREAFTRAGLSRPRSLSELRFSVQVDEETATAVVLVTTKSAVKEPFLNFLVEADWAKGRVLREFTVLLDPPFYANTPAPAASSKQATEVPDTASEVPSAGVIADNEPATSSNETSDQSGSDGVESESVESDSPATIAVAPASTGSSLDSPQLTTEQQSTTESMAVAPEPEVAPVTEESAYNADQSDRMIVGDLQVVKGDTLWSIANQLKDARHSMSQVMLALQQMNPEAFGDNNINFLKVGSVLRAPGTEQLDSFGEQEALAEVLVQNGLWDGYVENVSGTTAVSTAGDGGDSGSYETVAEEQSNLSLLAPGEDETDASGVQGDGEAISELSKQLAFAEEELDAARIENADLESRISELEATLSKVQELQRMVEIEDDSMAQLQANQNEEAATTEVQEIEEASLESITAEQIADSTEALTEEMNSVDEEALLEELLTEDPTAATGQTETLTEPENLESEPVAEATPPAETAPPAPVVTTEPVQASDSFMDGIIATIGGLVRDPLLLGGVGGILLLLLGLFGYKKWQAKKGVVDLGESDAGDDIGVAGADSTVIDEEGTRVDDDFAAVAALVGDDSEQTAVISPNIEEIVDGAIASAEEDDFSATEIISSENIGEALTPTTEAPAAEPEAEDEQQDDALNEVDVYLAYGLYDNAEDLLKQSLEASPNRADYRSKLLDTYFATKNATEFVKHAEILKGMGDTASRHWDRVQVMGYELAPDNDLFSGAKDSTLSTVDLGIAKPEVADFDLGSGNEEGASVGETDFLLTDGSDELEESNAPLTDTQSFVETVTREDDVVEEVDDELSDLEFSFDAGDVSDELDAGSDEGEGMNFELPDDMGDAEITADSERESTDFELDEALNFDEDESVNPAVETDNIEATAIIRPGTDLDDVDMDDLSETSFDFSDSDAASEIDTGIEIDTGTEGGEDINGIDEAGDIDLGLDDITDISDIVVADVEDQTDISEIDLGIDDIASADLEVEVDTDDFDLDLDGKPVKTDTFAPGDFDDPDEMVPAETDITGVNIDDIDDLVLPDDVDEVSTKLDLARAFIDMGDSEGARSSLDEVMTEGNEEQKAEAEALLKQV